MNNEIRINKNLGLDDLDTSFGTGIATEAETFWKTNPLQTTQRGIELSEGTENILSSSGIAGSSEDVIDSTSKISQEEALKKIDNAGISGRLEIGKQGINPDVLDKMISRKKDEIKRQAIVATAPDTFTYKAASFGTGLAVSLADPINIASAFIPVVGAARYGASLAKASGALGRAGVRAKYGAAAGIVGAAVVEPLVLLPSLQEQSDYGLYDSFLNVTFGGVLGGGLHASSGAIGDVISKTKIETKSNLLKGATGQLLDEGKVDVSHIAATDPSFMSAWDEMEASQISFKAQEEEVSNIIAELNGAREGAPNRLERTQLQNSVKETQGKLNKAKEELKRVKDKSNKKYKKEGIKKSEAVKEAQAKVDEIETQVKSGKSGVDLAAQYKADKGDITRLQQGIIPERFKERVEAAQAKALEGVKRFEPTPTPTPAPKPKATPEAKAQAEASAKIKKNTNPVREVETETNDILAAIDDTGQYSVEKMAELKKELSQADKKHNRDLAGIKAGVLCAIGR